MIVGVIVNDVSRGDMADDDLVGGVVDFAINDVIGVVSAGVFVSIVIDGLAVGVKVLVVSSILVIAIDGAV